MSKKTQVRFYGEIAFPFKVKHFFNKNCAKCSCGESHYFLKNTIKTETEKYSVRLAYCAKTETIFVSHDKNKPDNKII